MRGRGVAEILDMSRISQIFYDSMINGFKYRIKSIRAVEIVLDDH